MCDPHAAPDRAAMSCECSYGLAGGFRVHDCDCPVHGPMPERMLPTLDTVRLVVERVISDALDECDRAQTHWSKRPEIVARALEREGLIR